MRLPTKHLMIVRAEERERTRGPHRNPHRSRSRRFFRRLINRSLRHESRFALRDVDGLMLEQEIMEREVDDLDLWDLDGDDLDWDAPSSPYRYSDHGYHVSFLDLMR